MIGDYSGFARWFMIMFVTIFSVVIILVAGMIYYSFESDEVVSDEPIQPQIRLVIKDNKVDTTYVYKVNKK